MAVNCCERTNNIERMFYVCVCVCFYNNVTCLSKVINKQLQPSEQQQIKATCVSRIRKHKTSVQLHTRLYSFMLWGRILIFTDRLPEDDCNMAETCYHETILRINININQSSRADSQTVPTGTTRCPTSKWSRVLDHLKTKYNLHYI
jgi:hypothetical protein